MIIENPSIPFKTSKGCSDYRQIANSGAKPRMSAVIIENPSIKFKIPKGCNDYRQIHQFQRKTPNECNDYRRIANSSAKPRRGVIHLIFFGTTTTLFSILSGLRRDTFLVFGLTAMAIQVFW